MKMRLKYGTLSAMWLVLVAVCGMLIFGGCNKRPYTRIKQLPLKVIPEWSEVPEDAELPATLEFYLYREDGTMMGKYTIPKDGGFVGSEQMVFSVGVYHMILVNQNDYVEMVKPETFATAQICAKKASTAYLQQNNFSKADGVEVIYQPGWIFSSSLENVNLNGIVIVEDDASCIEVKMPMKRQVKVVNFKINLTGLTDEITSVKGLLGNVASGVDLSTGAIVGGMQCASPFELTDISGNKTTWSGNMLIFGNQAEIDAAIRNKLQLIFGVNTSSGRTLTHEEDITEKLINGAAEGDLTINVEADIEVKMNAGFLTVIVKWKDGQGEEIEGI